MKEVGDVVKRGQHVKVKVLSVSGAKLSLSMRVSVFAGRGRGLHGKDIVRGGVF